MANYLFLYTLGPIQEFIASARRSRDLWFGSFLLSDLSCTAASELRKHGTLIFPSDLTLPLDRDVANRIMAEVALTVTPEHIAAAKDEGAAIQAALAGIGAKVDTAVRAALTEYANKVFIARLTDVNVLERARQQVADLLETYWAVVPIEPNYQAARANLEAAIAAVKNTRAFHQSEYVLAGVPKSSIDGLRESVIHEDMYPNRQDSDDQRKKKSKRLFDQYGAGQAERLSGVDLLKRLGKHRDGRDDFPSTSHFAALPLLARFAPATRVEAHTRWNEYLRVLQDCGVSLRQLDQQQNTHPTIADADMDGSLLFASRLGELIEDPMMLRVATGALQTFLAAFTDGKAPEPYYAILHADGDNIGKVIDRLAHDSMERHREFSKALDDFAARVRGIVEDSTRRTELNDARFHGRLIYAGGDDVLAFLPLHTALLCANELADTFQKQLEAFAYDDDKASKHIEPTLSVGLVIAHHMEPLSDVLTLARKAEKTAKAVDGKNALAITLSKRGGGDRTISGAWSRGMYGRLLELTAYHRVGAIPDSAGYDLNDLIERVGDTLPLPALKAEALRILKRKRGQQGRASEANAQLLKLAEELPETKEAAQHWNVAQFASELIISREFARAEGLEAATSKESAT